MKSSNNTHYNYNSYHAAKVIISAYLTAYLYDADIKTAVYDRFMDGLSKKNTESPINESEDKERKQILRNCLHYFTNPENKAKLDLIKQQSNEVGRESSYNDLITEIMVLPAFAHAYLNGLDITDVYQKFANDIPNNTNPQTVEKQKLLANCLNLFRNPRCREELDALKQQLNITMTNSELSDIIFAEEISANFPEMISIVSDRRDFAEIVLPYFVTAYTKDYEIKAVFDKFQKRIPNNNSKASADRRKVLENCLDFFQTAKFRQTSNSINNESTSPIETVDDNGRALSEKEISDKILFNFSDDICGNKKRKYNMSNLYSSTAFKSASLKFRNINSTRSTKQDDKTKIYSNNGDLLVIVPIGELTYPCDAFGNESNIHQFAIRFESDDHKEVREAEVFTTIDFDRLDEDNEYFQAFIGEVFSEYNIRLSNACGYIGELVPQHNMQVGEEREEIDSYSYQTSPKYALVYDYEPLSAVVEYTRRQEKNTQEKKTDPSGR